MSGGEGNAAVAKNKIGNLTSCFRKSWTRFCYAAGGQLTVGGGIFCVNQSGEIGRKKKGVGRLAFSGYSPKSKQRMCCWYEGNSPTENSPFKYL